MGPACVTYLGHIPSLWCRWYQTPGLRASPSGSEKCFPSKWEQFTKDRKWDNVLREHNHGYHSSHWEPFSCSGAPEKLRLTLIFPFQHFECPVEGWVQGRTSGGLTGEHIRKPTWESPPFPKLFSKDSRGWEAGQQAWSVNEFPSFETLSLLFFKPQKCKWTRKPMLPKLRKEFPGAELGLTCHLS